MANRNWSRATLMDRLLIAVTENDNLAPDLEPRDILDTPDVVDAISLTDVISALKSEIVMEAMGDRLAQ